MSVALRFGPKFPLRPGHPPSTFYLDNSHLSQQGHKLTAEVLNSILEQKNLLPARHNKR